MAGVWVALERSDLGHHRPPRRKTAAGWLEPVRHKGLTLPRSRLGQARTRQTEEALGPLSSILFRDLGHHRPPRRKTALGWLKPVRHKGLTLPRAATAAKPEQGRSRQTKRGPWASFSIAYSENWTLTLPVDEWALTFLLAPSFSWVLLPMVLVSIW